MKPFDFRTSGYFSVSVFFLAFGLLIIGLALLLTNIIASIILLLIVVVIFTTNYRLTIDVEKKTFHDYLWILGFKSGEKGKYERIDYLFIKKNKVSQTMSLKAATSTITRYVYDGYLRFSEQEKIHLLTSDNKSNVVAKLEELSFKLGVKIIDYSEGEPKEI